MAEEPTQQRVRFAMEKTLAARTPPDGIITRPQTSSGRAVPNLLDWQSVPFEILNPDHSTTGASSVLATPLGFRRSDQDLMFQSHPSLFAPIQFPLSDLDPGDTTSLYPVSPASCSEGPGDGATFIDEKQSIQALLSDTEQSYNNAVNIGAIDDKTGFWDTVMCSPTQGRTTNVIAGDVLDLLPTTSTVPVPFPPLPQTGLSIKSSPPKPFPPFLPSPTTVTHPESVLEASVPSAPIPVVVDTIAKERQERPYECSQCGLRFRKRCNAINHTKIVHEKLRPYKCSHCDRAFGKKSNCQKHEKLHISGLKFGQRSGPGRISHARAQGQQAMRSQIQAMRSQMQGQVTNQGQLRAKTKVSAPQPEFQPHLQPCIIPDLVPVPQSSANDNVNNLLPFSKLPEPRSPDGVLSMLRELKD